MVGAFMNIPDVIDVSSFLQKNPNGAIRTVIYQTNKDLINKTQSSNVVLWQIPKNHSLPAHKHPNGQDTWLIVSGCAKLIDDKDSQRIVQAGEIVVIDANQKHGIYNFSNDELILLSIVDINAGFVPLNNK